MTQKASLRHILLTCAFGLAAAHVAAMPTATSHEPAADMPLPCPAMVQKTDSADRNGEGLHGKFRNEEYKIFIVIDVDSQSVVVPGQEFLGEMAGYLGADRDSRLWFFTSAEPVGSDKATIYITNDYGSEDLKATATLRPDGTLVLKQNSGSRIKIVVNGKWLKLPTEIEFKPTR